MQVGATMEGKIICINKFLGLFSFESNDEIMSIEEKQSDQQ